MTDNFSKCCHCGDLKKKEELLAYFANNCKFTLCKICFDKNIISNTNSYRKNSPSNNEHISQFNIIIKKEDEKKLDLNECTKNNDISFLLSKKRRISKIIVFKRKKPEIIDNFTNAINKLIFTSAENNKLIITSKGNKKYRNKTCGLCKIKKLIKEKKMINFSTLNNVISFYDELYNSVEQDENRNYLIKYSQMKYNQIVEQKKTFQQLKSMKNGNDLNLKSNEILCFPCINELLIKNNGINLLWENLFPEEDKKEKKNMEILSDIENILINTSKNIKTNFNDIQIKEEDNKTDKNIILDDDINYIFDSKKVNIFDLILGDEEDEQGDLNDIENNSDEKSSKNKLNNNNDNQKMNESQKDKKIIKGKSKEKKITFKKTIGCYNQPIQNDLNNIKIRNFNKINNNTINQNINTNNNINNNYGDKNKNINIINMNNINNISQLNDSKYAPNNSEQIQPFLYNNYYNPSSNQNNPIYNSNIINNINNNNLGYLNNNYPQNDETIYDRLTNQLDSLKIKLNLISNLNNSRIEKSNIINNDLQFLISNAIFKDNLFFFQNSMHLILNYMNNISEMLEKYSFINENSLRLMNSMISGTIGKENLMQLKNNSNYFSQLLNYNYNIQKMNNELCDIINNHLNH